MSEAALGQLSVRSGRLHYRDDMRFGVLGPVAVWTDDGDPVKVPELKVRALLADLLVQDGRSVSADRLVDDLWGEEPPGNPAAALQNKVWQLRKALGEAEPGGRDLVVSRPPGYLLQVDAGAVDADRFAALTDRARASDDPRTRATLLADALALWRGPALADFGDEEFARPAIARLEEQRLVALEEQAEARLKLGEHSLLVGELGDLVARHPLRERLRAAQLRALYRAGRQSEALASYAELRDRLADELGLDPGSALVALHQRILQQDPTLDVTSTPATSSARPRTNLPAQLTGLVGRENAVGEVRALLDRVRLVTLTGSGGVGKTRLAVETAAQLTDSYPDGVWLIELAALGRVGDGDMVGALATEIMTVLGIREDAAGERVILPELLAGALRAKDLLLVLDNCEHLVTPVAELAELLLHTVPGLRILATSQEALGIGGEQLWTVPPLGLPDPGADAEPEALERASAVRLFVERAAAAAPGFAVDADNARAVAAICRRLDGIPLALELAATRVRALGVHELLARLDDRFRVLASGHRGAPPRQQTLRAMIDWSWQLLSEPERIALRRLAVHAEGCTLEAAEEVCAGDDLPAEDIMDLLAHLVDRSLVVAADRAGGLRYRLLESVAAYCVDRLREAGELERVRERHDRYYVDLAERADSRLRGCDQRQWLERLDAESANLRGALDGAAQRGDAASALRLVNGVTWYWFLRGRLAEALRSLDVALAVDGDAPGPGRAMATALRTGIGLLTGETAGSAARVDAALRHYDGVDDPGGRARAEWFLSFATSSLGDPTVSENLANRALVTFRERADRWGIAAALVTAAGHAIVRGDLTAFKQHGEQSFALFRELGDRWGLLRATEELGGFAEVTGDYEQATRLHRDGLRMAEELGLWTQAADRLSWLGRTALLLGDYAQSRELHERARRLATEQRYGPGMGFAEIGLALTARREGKLDMAETLLRTVLERGHRVDFAQDEPEPMHPTPHALILAELGFVAEQRGDAQAARALHLDGLDLARGIGDPRAVALALEGLAGAHTVAGRHDQAARLLGAAAAARQSVGAPLAHGERGDVDRISERARAALGPDAFAAELDKGAALDLDTVADWA